MSKRPSPKALAKAVRQGRMDCDAALDCHLHDNCGGALDLTSAQVVLSNAAMGRWDMVLNHEMTVADMIEEFGLRPFIDLFRGDDQDNIALGELVQYSGQTYRVIGIRQVWPFAAPRTDDWEVMLESLDGEPLYFVGMSMIEEREQINVR